MRAVTKGKEIENILDECLERLLVKGETVEQCLESYPEHAAELGPLLRTALATSNALDIQPSTDFMARARYQLYAELDRAQVRQRRPIFGWQPRWALIVVVVLTVLLVGGGTVVAADSSMPGSPLYPVKLATENIRLKLSLSDVRKAELYAALADRRVAEIARMIEKGRTQLVERTAQRLRNHLAMMSRLSLVRYEAARAGQVAPSVAAEKPPATTSPQKTIGEDQPSVSARTITATGTRNGRLRLMLLLGHYAVNHPARLRAMLEEAPESARPAIREAITVSVITYRKALEELEQRPGIVPEEESSASENGPSDR